uniref:Uncharacterized protein n=1 Tax=Acrobeloides nanus TaxID=290746 RepID=A0A914DV61_9BILA
MSRTILWCIWFLKIRASYGDHSILETTKSIASMSTSLAKLSAKTNSQEDLTDIGQKGSTLAWFKLNSYTIQVDNFKKHIGHLSFSVEYVGGVKAKDMVKKRILFRYYK